MKIGKFITGALSGAAFGVLFAPKKGKKLRDEIKKKKEKSGHDAFKVLIDAFKEAGIEALEETKTLSENENLKSAVGNSKEKMQAYFSQIEKTGYDIAERAKEKMEELQKYADKTTSDVKKKVTKKKKAAKKAVKKVAKKAKSDVKKAKKVVKKATSKAKAVKKKVEKKVKK